MRTKVHEDRIIKDGKDKGYSIRVGKNLPENSANLAYMNSRALNPKENILLTDLSSNIAENGLPSHYVTEKLVYPDDSFMLKELNGSSDLPTDHVILTDEFSVPKTTQDTPQPLWYKATLTHLFDATNAQVYPYLGGYMNEIPNSSTHLVDIDQAERDSLIYLGNKIQISYLNGNALPSNYLYKIHLIGQSGEGIPANSYLVEIYTNFKGSKDETFLIKYDRYNSDGTHSMRDTEILNAYPYFNRVDKSVLDALIGQQNMNLDDKQYAVIETGENIYTAYAPAQVLIANNKTRPADSFKYRITSKMSTRLNEKKTDTIKVGIAYLNNTIINMDNLSSTLKKIYEDQLKPGYLDMENPYPPEASLLKKNSDGDYWKLDLTLPIEHLLEYDLIILTGYGYYDLSEYVDNLNTYLQYGGTIWVDNGGTGDQVLSFTSEEGQESFVTNIHFSKVLNAPGYKASTGTDDAAAILDRLYLLNSSSVLNIGYSGINPQYDYGTGENQNNWESIVRYSNQQPSVMMRTFNGKGRIIVSNCGIFRALYQDNNDNTKFIMNMILTIDENRWFTSPWFQDYVYHRDNLFQGERGNQVGTYYDDYNDWDQTQIVAKKKIDDSCINALLRYVPTAFQGVTGEYHIELESNTEINLSNNSMESGSFDPETGTDTTEWTATTAQAIPGWDTVRLAGSAPQFTYLETISARGTRAIQVVGPNDGTGSQAFWKQTTQLLPAGTYQIRAWFSTQKVTALSGAGATIGVYDDLGNKLAVSDPLLGDHSWTEISVTTTTTKAMTLDIRLGFTDGNGTGTVQMDMCQLYNLGTSVYMTPDNDGSAKLYAYAVRPMAETFDLKSQGYDISDVTIYNPEVTANITIRSFVYSWDNYTGTYVREYGNYVTYKRTISKSDGVITIGMISTLIPALNSGADWADRDKVYYEIFLGANEPLEDDSKFINLEIYNADTGEYFYNKMGEMIVNYLDLFPGGIGGYKPQIELHMRTNYYTVRATKSHYGLKVEDAGKIYIDYPSTIDDRDGWYLRIHNGEFIKNELTYQDLLSLIQYSDRYYEFQQRLFGTHTYNIPEYDRQLFLPSQGLQIKDKELAEYVDDRTLQTQNYPLYIQKGTIVGEELSVASTDGRMFKSSHGSWDKSRPIHVYVDEDQNGSFIEISDGFDVDYEYGSILFDEQPLGPVKADFSYNNLHVYKRTYNNVRVNRERLSSQDGKTFISSHKNWMTYPMPIIYILPYGSGDYSNNIAVPDSYTVDYENGGVIFKEEINSQVFATFAYSTDIELEIRDTDDQNGKIYLTDDIDFKDDIYISYTYEENFYEYRGYYNEELNQFISLDFNPLSGHYVTLPDDKSYQDKPSIQLMNMEVYLYIIARKDSFQNQRQNTIKHCYSLEEWQAVQKANPAALLLGIAQLRTNSNINDITVLDARNRGGGLKESIKDNEIKSRAPFSTSYWDMGAWEGEAYYKNGSLIINVPKTVLQAYGGQFTERQVDDTVKKYIAYGIYYIIEYI